MADAIATLIETYHELNASVIDELDEEPSPLEFMRYVARNLPFVVRGAASDWTASRQWDARYLEEAMAGQQVNVAVTPLGNADAVVDLGGSLTFVEPHETSETFEEFLAYVREDSTRCWGKTPTVNVKYAQTQNDNLRDEYSNLFEDVLPEIAFARIALQQRADAINIWVGNQRSVTALHRDPYQNVYVQIRGEKHFVLLSPVEAPCVSEQLLPRGRYVQDASTSELKVIVDEKCEQLPVPVWDPDSPEKRVSSYSKLARPLRVTLKEGDMLYLPAMWYHKVSQTAGPEGFACAVNWWYDLDYTGSFWALNSFIRDVGSAERLPVVTSKQQVS